MPSIKFRDSDVLDLDLGLCDVLTGCVKGTGYAVSERSKLLVTFHHRLYVAVEIQMKHALNKIIGQIKVSPSTERLLQEKSSPLLYINSCFHFGRTKRN